MLRSPRAPRRLGRWLGRALGLGLALVLGLLLLLRSSAGRAWLLGHGLRWANQAIPGHVGAARLRWTIPCGAELTGLTLDDPAGQRVVSLERLEAQLLPGELFSGRIVLSRLAIEGGFVDVSSEDAGAGRGVLAAVSEPRSSSDADSGPPPYVRIEELRVHGLAVRGPELPRLGALEARQIELESSLELDGGVTARLERLTLELARAGRRLAQVGPVRGELARQGGSSHLEAELLAGALRWTGEVRGVVPPAPGFRDAPLTARLELRGLRASDLAEWLREPELGSAFEGELALGLRASGRWNDLSVEGRLQSQAGTVGWVAKVRSLRQWELALQTEELRLRQLRPDLPAAPLAVRLDVAADTTDPAAVPLHVRVGSARFAGLPLPDVEARALWRADGLEGLRARLVRGRSSLELEGAVQLTGAFDLNARLDLRPTELATAVAALEPAPRSLADLKLGGVRAALRVGRRPAGELHAAGQISAAELRAADVRVGSARIDLDVRGALPELRGRARARLEEVRAGRQAAELVELGWSGGPRAFHLDLRSAFARSKGPARLPLDGLQAAFDVELAPEREQARLRGQVRGSLQGEPFELEFRRTRLHASGAIQTEGIRLLAAGQSAQLSGGWGRAGSVLRLRADELDLARLARLAQVELAPLGKARLDARLAGSVAAPRLDLEIEATALRFREAAPLDARVTARLDARAGELQVEAGAQPSGAPAASPLASARLSTRFGGGAGWVRRLAGAENDLELEIRELELEQVEGWLGRRLPARGPVSLRLTLDGAWPDPALNIEVDARVVPRATGRAMALAQHIEYRAGALHTRLALADAVGPWLRLRAQLLGTGTRPSLEALLAGAPTLLDRSAWQLELEAAPRRGSELPLPLSPNGPDFRAGGRVEVRHQPGAEPSADARLTVLSEPGSSASAACSAQGLQLELEAQLAGGRLRTLVVGQHDGRELLRGHGEAELQLAAALRGGPLRLGALSGELLSKALQLQSLPFACGRVQGRLDAAFTLHDLLGTAPSLEARLALDGFTLGAGPELDASLRAHADRDSASAELELTAPQGRSRLRASLPIEWSGGHFALAERAPVSARVHLDHLPLAPLLDPGGAISQVSGTVSGDVEIEGPLLAPLPRGYLELEDAAFTATTLAQPLQGIRGRFELEGGRVRILRLQARDGSGSLRVSGQSEWVPPGALDATLDIIAEDFPLRQQGRTVATTSARAQVEARVRPQRTDVRVLLADADTWLEKLQERPGLALEAHPDVVLVGASAAPAEMPAAAEPELEALPHTTSLTLDASDRFWVKREDFAIQLAARLTALIDEQRTRVEGKVEMDRGYLDLMGRIFEVQRGSSLTFTGSDVPDPALAIEATHDRSASGRAVTVKIGGRGSRPELSFWIADAKVSAGDALAELVGRGRASGEDEARNDAKAFVSGVTAGLLATSARRELGAAAPILMIEPGERAGSGRIRAGFELDSLLPEFLRRAVTGVYVEGIVAQDGGAGQASPTRAGVLVELYFPHQLFSIGQWGPGTTWSLDWGWQVR